MDFTHLKNNFSSDQIVKKDKFLMLELKFLTGSLEFIDRKIDFFERNDAQIHNLYEEMGLILSRQIQIFMKETVLIDDTDEEGNLVFKQFEDLLDVDPRKEKDWKSRSDISLGPQAETYLKKLGLVKDSPYLDNFFKLKVFPFYTKIVEMLQKYFTKGLKSPVLAACSSLGPNKKNSSKLLSNMRFLGSKYEKVLKQYSESTNYKEEFESQVIEYQRLGLEPEVLDLPFGEFWKNVGEITIGGEKNGLRLLSKFSLGLGTQFNSNSKIERQFKAQSTIHSDKHRNKLDQDMLDSYLTVKSGVESLKVRDLCEKCKKDAEKIAFGEVKNPRPHCHCCFAKPSDKMLEKCRSARKCYGKEMEDKKKDREENDEVLAERRKVTEIVINEDLDQWKEDLETRSTFLEDEALEGTSVHSKQPKKVAKQSSSKSPEGRLSSSKSPGGKQSSSKSPGGKQSSSKSPISAKNRVAAARVLQVKRKLSKPAVPVRAVKRRHVEIVTEAQDMIKDVATASGDVIEDVDGVEDPGLTAVGVVEVTEATAAAG